MIDFSSVFCVNMSLYNAHYLFLFIYLFTYLLTYLFIYLFIYLVS